MASKRRASGSSSDSAHKASRAPATGSGALIHTCTLPPTCAPPGGTPTALPDGAALAAHTATYHTHVCAGARCRAVFPAARFLELHLTECHDPLAAARKERGEKIFACFVEACPKHFSTPKTRRLHLVEAHAYPKQYFFALPNHGIGGLLRRYGEGASLVRPDWKPRDDDDADADADADLAMDAPPKHEPGVARDAPPHLVKHAHDVDALAASLDSLALVPRAGVRFGRGAAHPAFDARSRNRAPRRRAAKPGADEGEDSAQAEAERKEVVAFVPASVRGKKKDAMVV